MTVLATTELEAVNVMLSVITEAPVTTLGDDTIEDAAVALTTLREVSRQFQASSWHFNTDYDYVLTVDGDEKIPYPTSAASVDAMDTENLNVAKRGNFLWDIDNQRFTFPGKTSIKAVVVWLYDFEDLPQTARTYITLMAARRFAKNVMGDEVSVQYTREDEGMARAQFVTDDLRKADYNMLTASNTVNRAVRRRSPWPV